MSTSKPRRILSLVGKSSLPTPDDSGDVDTEAGVIEDDWELPGPPDGRRLYVVRGDA